MKAEQSEATNHFQIGQWCAASAVTRRRLIGLASLGMATLVLANRAGAEQAYRDFRRTIFVARRGSTSLDAIDVDADTLAGTLELGLEPHDLQISQRGGRLIAIDRRNPTAAVVDLVTRTRRLLPLPLVPSRIRISPDGQRFAVFDDRKGTIVLFDGSDGSQLGRIDGPHDVREAIFSGDGTGLFVVASGVDGISVYDTANASSASAISGPSLATLLRAPNGREGFALSAATPRTILHVDLRSREILATLPQPEAAALYTTGTGIQLLAIDHAGGTLSILPAEPLRAGSTLPTATGSAVAYSAWFDTVAFVPDSAARKLLIFDLERRRQAGSIALDGAPGTGVVTPDGDKLYLPIEDQGTVAVIDTHLRQRTASIVVGANPVQAIIAGGYGLCH
jgi:YVTN family beta-propeller protein